MHIIIIDFETTGLSPQHGARPTEVAAVRIKNGQITDHYQSLMNAGVSIPAFIENLTGINNTMIRTAPPVHQVMHELAEFIGDTPLVAHNAVFDSKFLDIELAHIGLQRRQEMLCSLLLARRCYPHAPTHKLTDLIKYIGLPSDGHAHRALADVQMTARLWLHMLAHLCCTYHLSHVPLPLLAQIQRIPVHSLTRFMSHYCKGA
ncbi:3'-5' exonuclease [Beggiatoa leptomitoformis]|uniref:DNA-directed DNA polymerase n=1 Tax=Beggiatoa leptomitoformis TaxID=288004 RepID=A0A2N9YHW6_9GAMM|nr:3'-5' exonuclease [Beggiatoa leptomitoformis]ALG67668.1 3'-5' exonuclease [Beggiatoa leptomitoformis]AUI70097.1 3'-5' exonuclease [Beggiatoa leptomitoformis]